MDPKDREELSELRREQQRLQGELAKLSRKFQELEGRFTDAEAVLPAGEPEAVEVAPIETEKILRKTPPPVAESAKTPPPITPQPAGPKSPAPQTQLDQIAKEMSEGMEAKTANAKPAGDWELNLGKVWFVRIGVGLLLTGLVFLSLYAYKNWIFNASALVKVSFFFAVSLAMVGGGYFIERRKEELRQYGQALSAGGLAAGYYTIYAAHFVPALKVIGSPIAAAILLCLWAGGMLGYSVWRKGRILAVMSIGLAYYGTVINPSGWISLFSSLVLSASAMFLLIRYRWVWVGAVGLIAAYLSHAFWTSMVENEVTEPVRVIYLACTWLLFTAALQVPQSKVLEQSLRRAMMGINNTAFWALVVFHIPKLFPSRWLDPANVTLQPHDEIGWISIGIGAAWMLIAAVTWLRGAWRREYAMLWGFQGLFIATLGLMIEASGYSRFLMLAAEACVLLAAARWIAPKWTRLAAILCFLASSAFALLEGIQIFGDLMPHWSGYTFTALFGFAFVVLMRRDIKRCSQQERINFYGSLHGLAPLFFAWVPWVILVFGAILRWDPEWSLIGLLGAPLATALVRLFVERDETIDIPLLSPLVVVFAGFWLMQWEINLPIWSFAVATLMAGLYWLLAGFLRYTSKPFHKQVPLLATEWVEWITAAVILHLLFRWLNIIESRNFAWLVLAPLIAVSGSVIHVLTRRCSLALLLGVFHSAAILYLLTRSHHDLGPLMSAMPLLGVLAHLALGEWQYRQEYMKSLRALAGIGVCIAFAGFLMAQNWSNPGLWLTLSSALWLAYSFKLKHGASAITGSLLPLFCVSLGYALDDPGGWKAYLCLPILPIAALMVRQLDYQSEKSWMAFRRIGGFVGLILLGAKLSRHVLEVFDAGRAISWGLYAVLLFAVGLVFTDKFFRRFGLFYLLIAVLHILTVDVMKLDTLGRILSFITLGAVLLLLGFLYNQYQDKIRKYL